MNIVGIYGSPRPKGNSAQALDYLLKSLEGNGETITAHHLNQLSIKGCQACYSCRQPGKERQCAVQDDMSRILADVFAADAIILASPVYMWQVTAQAKLFTDRLMPVLKPDYTSWLTGQKLLPIYTQGQPDGCKFRSYFDYVHNMYSFLGFNVLTPVVLGGLRGTDDIQKEPDMLQQLDRALTGFYA